MKKIFMNTENSKTNESNKFIYQFTDKFNLKIPNNKNIGLANLSIYYTYKKIKSAVNNKFKISASTWNDVFDLPNGLYSISDIDDYFEFIFKNTKLRLAENPPIQFYLNKIKSRSVFEVKTGYKLEMSSKEPMKILGSAKKRC